MEYDSQVNVLLILRFSRFIFVIYQSKRPA